MEAERAALSSQRLAWFAVLYVASIYASLFFLTPEGGFSAIWLAGGVLIGFMVISTVDEQPWLLGLAVVLAFVTQVLLLGSDPVSVGVFTLSNVIEAAAAATVIRHMCGGANGFGTSGDVLRFVVLAVIAIPLLTSLIPTIYLSQTNEALVPSEVYIEWLCSAGLGTIYVAPWLIAVNNAPWRRPPMRATLELLTAATVCVALALMSFGVAYNASFNSIPLMLLLLLLMWCACRFEQLGFASISLLWVLIAVSESAAGYGPFTLASGLALNGILGLKVIALFAAIAGYFASVEMRNTRSLHDEKSSVEASKKELESIVARSPTMLFIWEPAEGWPVRYASPSVSQLGYTPEDFTDGHYSYAELMHPDDLPGVMQEVRKRTEQHTDNYVQEYRLKARSGDYRWINDFTWINRSADGVVESYEGILLDISGQKASEARVARSERRLSDIARDLPGALFQYQVDADGSDAIFSPSQGCESIWEYPLEVITAHPEKIWEEIVAEDLEAMQRTVQLSAESLSHWEHEWRIQTPSGLRKWLHGIGTPRRLEDGGTIWNTMIFDVTHDRDKVQATANTLSGMVRVLAATHEARDAYTAGHQERTSKICRKIAPELGLGEYSTRGLELAARIHDIGKIQVPSDILNKPTNLTKPEFDMIKTHPETGAELLRGVKFDWPIADIIRQHHERFDGSGYPDGLSGESILLEARILAVADTLEAMWSHRPYRPAIGIDGAVEELREGRGIRYDPMVVDVCIDLVARGELTLDDM